MAFTKVSLPRKIYRSESEEALPDQFGARLIDGYVDELGVIHKRPGLSLFVDLGEPTSVQGLYWWDDKEVLIAVSNGKIFKITDQSGAKSDVTGDGLTGSKIVSFANAGNTLVMANGAKMVTYTNSGTTAFMADADAPTAVDFVAFIDQYILATAGGQKFQWSGVNAPLTWDALDFANAETNPDFLQALFTAYREIYLFGKETLEIWFNDGVTPFRRIDSAYVEVGCIAPYSVVNARGTWLWLTNDRRLVRMEGRTPQIVSTPFDNVIRDINSFADAEAFYLPIGVRGFYVLSFPTQDQTFVYDLTTNDWAEWGTWNSNENIYNRYKGKTYTYAKAWNLHLVGDNQTGKIYKASASLFDDVGATMRTLLRTGHISHGTLNKKRVKHLFIRARRGLGAASPITDEPLLSMRYRDDNGPFSNETFISLGKIGENEFVRKISRMGMYRTRQYEFAYSENKDLVLSDLEEEVEALGY